MNEAEIEDQYGPDGRPGKHNIGNVGFAFPNPEKPWGWQGKHILGDERKRLLKLAKDGQPLPDGLFLLTGYCSGGNKPITADEVDWETSGIK